MCDKEYFTTEVEQQKEMLSGGSTPLLIEHNLAQESPNKEQNSMQENLLNTHIVDDKDKEFNEEKEKGSFTTLYNYKYILGCLKDIRNDLFLLLEMLVDKEDYISSLKETNIELRENIVKLEKKMYEIKEEHKNCKNNSIAIKIRTLFTK